MNTDKFVIRVVVVTIAGLTILFGVGMIVMAIRGDLSEQSIKETFFLVAGAMIGVLARTTSTGDPTDPPQEVQVMNEPKDPVPTTPAESLPVWPGPPPIIPRDDDPSVM